MSNSSNTDSDPYAGVDAIDTIECGKDAAKHFWFDDGWRNLNHGSFGTFPKEVGTVAGHFREQSERRPDWFIRYEYPRRNDEAREAVANVINAPVEGVVFVLNATTGVNTVLRNIVYEPGDVIIYFSTIYGSCHKTIEYMVETTSVQSKGIHYTYPISDKDLLSRFEEAIKSIKAEAKNPKLAVFDTVVSLPGVRMPFEQLTEICRKHGVLSCIDAAHSVGQIPLDLTKLDPDFFVSNCHKWLFAPRGCAVFYVPVRNQHLIRSTLPTSHGFVPKNAGAINNPLPPSSKSEFVNNFEFVGTVDNSAYLSVPVAIQWRSKVTYKQFGGEEAIREYSFQLAKEGGDAAAKILGTEVLENEEGSLRQCVFANVRMPLPKELNTVKVAQWISKTLVDEYSTFMAFFIHAEKIYVRLSAQIYLTSEDFKWAGSAMKEVCERAAKGEWDEGKSKL